MKFESVFIEKGVVHHPRTRDILNKLPGTPRISEIDRYDSVFGQVYKPYLQKRESLNLFIAEKKGNLVKDAPPAYGTESGNHYYFIHSLNCVYECQYCFLQGHFSSPDIVVFVNHEDVLTEIEKIRKKNIGNELWFHGGEFSDGLALTHLTSEWEYFFPYFNGRPELKLEVRTKSSNVGPLLSLTPSKNIYITYSLSGPETAKEFDKKVPSISGRVKAMGKLAQKGFQLGIHLDPIIYTENLVEDYRMLFKLMKKEFDVSTISYLSLGIVRFTEDAYYSVQKNYPDSKLKGMPFFRSHDGKYRYSQGMRSWILDSIKKIAVEYGVSSNCIYQCMEV